MSIRRFAGFPAGRMVLLALSMSVALPAQAFPGGRGGGWFGAQRQQQVQRERDFPQRRQNADRQNGDRQAAPQRPDNPQRMSPDERRQLRRDLREAGRDVYPQRRDWRR